MKSLGNGRFQDVDGRVYEYDGPDRPPPCSGCEDELADGKDGLCSFCREDAPRPTPPPAAPGRPHTRESYLAKFAPHLRAELEARRLRAEDGFENQRRGHALLDQVAELARGRAA